MRMSRMSACLFVLHVGAALQTRLLSHNNERSVSLSVPVIPTPPHPTPPHPTPPLHALLCAWAPQGSARLARQRLDELLDQCANAQVRPPACSTDLPVPLERHAGCIASSGRAKGLCLPYARVADAKKSAPMRFVPMPGCPHLLAELGLAAGAARVAHVAQGRERGAPDRTEHEVPAGASPQANKHTNPRLARLSELQCPLRGRRVFPRTAGWWWRLCGPVGPFRCSAACGAQCKRVRAARCSARLCIRPMPR